MMLFKIKSRPSKAYKSLNGFAFLLVKHSIQCASASTPVAAAMLLGRFLIILASRIT